MSRKTPQTENNFQRQPSPPLLPTAISFVRADCMQEFHGDRSTKLRIGVAWITQGEGSSFTAPPNSV